MHRRRFLRNLLLSAGGSAFAAASQEVSASRASSLPDGPIPLQVGGRLREQVPENFLGLGYEISSVARTGLLSPANRNYVSLVHLLGAHGVIRVGGNTSDDATYREAGPPHSAPIGSVVSRTNLEDLGAFLRATGWRLLWGLNLGTGTRAQAVEEAAAVSRAVGDRLLGFEIGNEPDLFARNPNHRSTRYGYEDYLREWRQWRAEIQTKLPRARFAGPDAADRTDWVERFARDEGQRLLLLTHHYYRECENPTSTIGKLLEIDPKLDPELKRLQDVSRTTGVPYRICEMNSFCGGGKPGVSDTFAAALWTLDILCRMAAHGCAGVNLQTGVNQRGFISSYSPVGDDDRGHLFAAPEFYGMLAFRHAQGPAMFEVRWGAGDQNAGAYAFGNSSEANRIVLVNKQSQGSFAVRLPRTPQRVLRLEARSLEATSGVTLGGSAVAADGTWLPKERLPDERLTAGRRSDEAQPLREPSRPAVPERGEQGSVVLVPAASAAVCFL